MPRFRAVLVCEEVMVATEVPEDGRTSVYESGSEFDPGWGQRVMEGEDAAAEAVARFEAEDGFTGARENAGSGESGDAGSDDDDIKAHA